MDLKIKITEELQLAPDPRFVALSDKAKHRLVDNIMSRPEETRGLYVTVGLTNSGKVTNSRIYPPMYVKDSIQSWTKPFQKPMLRNHDEEAEPLGRIQSVDWVSLDEQGIRLLKSASRYTQLLAALNAADAVKCYKLMSDFGLLDNSEWQGVGKLSCRVKVNDREAIEKFLDGRYQTVSWSTFTKGFTCMLCGAQWHKGKVCEHEIGQMSDEGEKAIFMTGPLEGREVSIVNTPANSYSTVETMSFQDAENEESAKPVIDKLARGPIEVVLSDSRFEWDSTIKVDTLENLATLDTKTIVGLLGTEALDVSVEDLISFIADEARSPEWLKSLQNDLNARFNDKNVTVDKTLEIASEINKAIKTAVLAGPEADKIADYQGALDELGVVNDTTETETEVPAEQSVIEPVINWFVLDLAFNQLLPDSAKLTAEQIATLDSKVFCHDKYMPLATHEHYLAAKKLMDKYEAPDKSAVLEIIDSLAVQLGVAHQQEPCKTCADYNQLIGDHANLLKVHESLNADFIKTLEYFSKDAGLNFETSDKSKLEILQDWFATIASQEAETAPLRPAENPIAEVDASDNMKTFSGFEKRVAASYKQILDTKGKSAADMYLSKNKKYLPNDFKI